MSTAHETLTNSWRFFCVDKMQILKDLPAADYHSDRGLFLTSHLLIEFHRGGIDGFKKALAEERKDTDAFRFGRAAHVLILEGQEAFNNQYDVGGPINPKTGKTYGTNTKKYSAWAKSLNSTREQISPEDVAKIKLMQRKLFSIKSFNQLTHNGKSEVSIRREMLGLPAQCRLDWITEFNSKSIILDLKTTVDVFGFQHDIIRYGYHWQMAFYRACYDSNADVYLVPIDKQPEPGGYVMRLDDGLLAQATAENAHAIEQIREVFLEFRCTLVESRKCLQKKLEKSLPN